MSLRIWLPLNGNYQNKGLSFVKYKSNYTPTYVEGKIGKCLNGTVSISMDAPEAIKSTSYTIAMWIKSNPTNTTSSVWWKIAQLTYADGTSNSVYTASEGRYKIEYNPEYNVYCNSQEWNHIAYVVEATKISGYVNGVLYGSTSCTNPERFLSSFMVGGNANTFINDVRLYDHCLSLKEIEEISQGLIAHYPLRDKFITKATNLLPYPTPGASATNSQDWDKTLHKDAILVGNGWGVGYNGGVNNPTAGYHAYWKLVDDIPTIVFPNLNSSIGQSKRWLGVTKAGLQSYFTSGDTFTISADVKADSPNMLIGAGLYYSNGTATNFHAGLQYQTVPTSWTRMTWTYTITGTYVSTADARLYIYGYTGAEGTSYVRNIQIEKGAKATPYVGPKTEILFTPKINDCSGYNYDLSIIGNEIYCIKDSIRNTHCISIPNGQTSYLKGDAVFFPYDKVTISCWFKSDSGVSGQGDYHIPFSGDNSLFEISIYSGGQFRSGLHVNGSRSVMTVPSKNLSDGNWHMITLKYDGAEIKRYVDGEIISEGTVAITGPLSGGNRLLTLGHYGTSTAYGNKQSYMSDVRLYATALSDEAIFGLYQTSISIDDLQNIHAHEFIEIDENDFRKNGTVNFDVFENKEDNKCSIYDSLLTAAYFIEK